MLVGNGQFSSSQYTLLSKNKHLDQCLSGTVLQFIIIIAMQDLPPALTPDCIKIQMVMHTF